MSGLTYDQTATAAPESTMYHKMKESKMRKVVVGLLVLSSLLSGCIGFIGPGGGGGRGYYHHHDWR
jgi:hypothetical protein